MKSILTSVFIVCVVTAYSQDSENVNLLFHWNDSSLVGSSIFDNTYNEIWGLVLDEKEYAVIGSTDGTHIFDMSDSNLGEQIAFVAGAVQGPQIIHRDYHDYNGYLYIVCDEGPSTLQIVDISTLPDTFEVVYDSNDLFSKSHNIFIDTATAKMYSTNGDIYSLENPEEPTLLYSDNILSSHDMYVLNDTAYINKGNSGFIIADFSQTTLENQNHEVLGSLPSYPQQGYNHSGWISKDRNYYIMADETWGMDMKMLDISDFNNIDVVSYISSEVDENSIPHNQIIKGDYLYTAYYHDGLYVHDISDPFNPILLAYYDTFVPDHHDSYMGAWGVYPFLPSGKILLSDMQTGLYVFDVDYSNPLSTFNDIEYQELLSYPNPVNDELNVLNSNHQEFDVSLFNVTGQLIYQLKTFNDLKIDVANFDSGTYILKVQSPTALSCQKIVVQ